MNCSVLPPAPFSPSSPSAAVEPTVRLPAVKVTLPAAMDYTGAHSQAEYDTALEGKSEARAGRDETFRTSGPHWDQPVVWLLVLLV